MKLRATSAADVDVVDAAVWLERQKAGLSDDFLDDLDATLAEIRRAPLGCPTLHFPRVTFKFDLRWLAVGRFFFISSMTRS